MGVAVVVVVHVVKMKRLSTILTSLSFCRLASNLLQVQKLLGEERF
jgi:hypothetical protein